MNDATEFRKIKTGDYVVPLKDALRHGGNYSEAYPTGFMPFDLAMRAPGQDQGGVRDGDLVIITGISGMGKTTFAQNIALNLERLALPSLFFSYEVLIDNLYAKFTQMGFKDGIIYTPKANITGNMNWIGEKIVEAKEKYMVKAVFIDHLDYLSPADNKTSDQLRMRLRNIAQELKTIAIKNEVVIFLLCHVKKVEGRAVEMQDIAESAGIYQLADYVFSVARITEDKLSGSQVISTMTNEGIIRMLKNRLTGEVPFMRYNVINNLIREKIHYE